MIPYILTCACSCHIGFDIDARQSICMSGSELILESGFTKSSNLFHKLHFGALCEEISLIFQVHDGGSYYSEDSTSPNVFSWMHALLDFAVTNFLPIGISYEIIGCWNLLL